MHKDKVTQWIGTDCPYAKGQNDPMDKDSLTLTIPETNKDFSEITQQHTEKENVVVNTIKSYLDISDNEMKKITTAFNKKNKPLNYLIEKLELISSNNLDIQNVVGYLISAIKNDYKATKKAKKEVHKTKTKFHNINQNFEHYDPEALEQMLLDSQKGKFTC